MKRDVIILGIHDGHNSGAALVKDGEVVAGIHEERLINMKKKFTLVVRERESRIEEKNPFLYLRKTVQFLSAERDRGGAIENEKSKYVEKYS